MTSKNFALPPEWSLQEAVIISWPHPLTDWNYILPWVTDCYIALSREIAKLARLVIVCPDAQAPKAALGNIDGVTIIEMPTNDTWTRDFGMICTVVDDGSVARINDFKFNGWGLKFPANFDNLINRNILSRIPSFPGSEYVNRLGFVLEGGSIDCDGHGSIMTTSECLLSPNRNGDLSREQIESRLKDWLGAEQIIWIEHGGLQGDDTDSHIDTLARFLAPDIIAYASCDRPNDEHYSPLQAMEGELRRCTDAQGRPYRLLALPIPEPIYDSDGQRLPATYANFLLLNGSLLLPTYGDEKYDAIAIEALRRAAPQYQVIPIDCRPLILQHGSLHCATMQIPPHALIFA